MAERRPHLIVLAGPNGAGKTTSAPALLKGRLKVLEFVNADVIARGLSGFAPESAAFEAGRVLLRRIKDLASRRADFAFETTLASRTFAPWIRDLIAAGYDFRLLFLWLPDPELAIERVQGRVRAGGHDVEPGIVRRRHARGWSNLLTLYRPLATSWKIFDASSRLGPQLIASGVQGRKTRVKDPHRWRIIEGGPRGIA